MPEPLVTQRAAEDALLDLAGRVSDGEFNSADDGEAYFDAVAFREAVAQDVLELATRER